MKHTHLHTRLLALLLCCALVLPLSACGEAKNTTQQIFAMDTVMDLTAYGKKADDGINAAISIINSMDTLLDPENERSKTYEINHAMGSPVVVNEQIAKMLRTALTVYERTNGAFDLTTYPLSKLWGFIDQNYRVPSDAEIERLLPCVDMRKVQLAATDDSANSLVTMPADMALSFGAVAKGCASDYAIQAMRAAGVTSGVVQKAGRKRLEHRHSGPERHRQLSRLSHRGRDGGHHLRQLSALFHRGRAEVSPHSLPHDRAPGQQRSAGRDDRV